MIEVFKTNVATKSESIKIISILQIDFSSAAINFDLHDCDKILRVANIKKKDCVKIISNLNTLGYKCEVLN